MQRLVVIAVLAGCGDNAVTPSPTPALEAAVVAELAPDGIVSIAALDRDRIAIARAIAFGDVLCPDCVDLEPSQCPAICKRTKLTIGLVGAEARTFHEVFPKSFDHDVNEVAIVALGGERVGVAWLDCDNGRCGAFAAKQSCTARYTTIDLATGATGPIATLYEDRFARLQLVANPTRMLAVTGMTYGAFGTGVRAAVFDHAGAPQSEWIAIGGADALSPAATAIGDDGFAIAVDDRRPADRPPDTPCEASCDCAGAIGVDPILGGLYVYELAGTGVARIDPVAIGLAQDGHLASGHYHARQVLAIMQRGGELVVAAGQAIDGEAELFVGRGDRWAVHGGFDSPIPTWIGVLGSADTAAWLGSQPQEGQATVNRIVAGTTDRTELAALTEPLDSHVLQVAPLATRDGISHTFLLRGLFGREGPRVYWRNFEIVAVSSGLQ